MIKSFREIRSYVVSHEISIGTVLFILSALTLLVLSNYLELAWLPLLLIPLNWIGILLIVDYLSRRILHRSFLSLRSKKSQIRLILIVIASYIIVLGVETSGFFINRLWYYPKIEVTLPTYFIVTPPFYFIYAFVLFVIYKLAKEKFGKKNRPGPLTKGEDITYVILIYTQLFLGLILFAISIPYLINLYQKVSVPLIKINISTGINIAWWFPFSVAFAGYSLFEFLSYLKDKSTLTKDFVRREFYPVLLIFIAALAGIAVFELLNVPLQIWKFANWPLQHIQILKIPLFAWLLWPMQFLSLLALLRFVLPEEDVDIW